MSSRGLGSSAVGVASATSCDSRGATFAEATPDPVRGVQDLVAPVGSAAARASSPIRILRTRFGAASDSMQHDPIDGSILLRHALPTVGMAALLVVTLAACQGGGGGGNTLNEPGGGYGVTSNVGTYEEDYLQDESPDQDPFADNPNPIPD